MKVILVGYPVSKSILSASSFLVGKYLPSCFDVYYLNYGAFTGRLLCGTYVNLDEAQHGGSPSWAKYIAKYLKTLKDEFIVFALDDYLLSKQIDMPIYNLLLNKMGDGDNIVCARLCISDFYKTSEYNALDNSILMLTDSAEYSATSQYCIWRRDFLIELLGRVSTVWVFEMSGSRYLNASGKKVIGTFRPAMEYNVSSALSTRWGNKIDVKGVNSKDVEFLVREGLI